MEPVTAVSAGQIGPRSPRPDRRLDLLWALAVTAVATVVYVAALVFQLLPPHGLAVAFVAAAPITAGFALAILASRAHAERDVALGWFSAGLAVAWVAMVLQLISFPAAAAGGGGFFRTSDESNSVLYLLFNFAPAAGAAAGVLRAPARWQLPGAVLGSGLALLLAVDAFPLPTMLEPDGSYTTTLLAAEYLVVAVIAACTWLWVWRAGRAAPSLRGWVGVSLSLSLYEVLLNAFAAERFAAVWWASLTLRVATYAVLALGAVASVLARLRDTESYSQSELARREDQLRTSLRTTSQLLACAEGLARAVTPAEVADALCRDAVAATGLPKANLFVSRPGEGLVLLGSAGYDEQMRAEVTDIGWDTPHPGPRTLLKGGAVFLTGAAAIRDQFPATARTPMRAAVTAAALPIRVGAEPVGALILWDSRQRNLTQADQDVLSGLAAQGGQALKRALAYEAEAEAAATLQRSLLPSALPPCGGMSLAARYVAGEQGLRVGGDWYDCLAVDDHRVALVVGDVMGKGLRAAAVMGDIRTSLRTLAMADPAPSTVLAGLDRLTQTLDIDEIATIVYVLLDLTSGTARVARAGHLPPLVVDPEGHAVLVEAGGSPPLGSPVDHARPEAQVHVLPGSTLLLYTDGIVEDRARGLDGLPDFVALVESLVDEHGADTESLASSLLTRTSADEREDDIALLLARFTGSRDLRGVRLADGGPGDGLGGGLGDPSPHESTRVGSS